MPAGNAKSNDIDIPTLSRFAFGFASDLRGQGCYPVMGAEGKYFFVDICAGPMSDRVTHKIIHLHFEPIEEPDDEFSFQDFESIIQVSKASDVIAFVFLLSTALGAETKILHPLAENGDFFPAWEDAVAIVHSADS
jgi:hypothetical protein